MSILSRAFKAFIIYRRAVKNPNTPGAVKWLPIASIVYLFWPIDFIPDLLPLMGQLDDIGIIALLWTIAWKLIPADVKKEPRNFFDFTSKPPPDRPMKGESKPIIDIDPR